MINKLKWIVLLFVLVLFVVIAVIFKSNNSLYLSGNLSNNLTNNQNNKLIEFPDKADSVRFAITSTSFGTRIQPVIKTENFTVTEGQSFYFSDNIKPMITKEVFKLVKINSRKEVILEHSNEVFYLLNDRVIEQAPNPFTLKDNKECFTTKWEGSGYKICIDLVS